MCQLADSKSEYAKLMEAERELLGGTDRWEKFCVLCDQNNVKHILQTDSPGDIPVATVSEAMAFWRYVLENPKAAEGITAGGVASALGTATASHHAFTSLGVIGAILKPIVVSVYHAKENAMEGKEWAASQTIIDAAKGGDKLARKVLYCVYLNTNRWGRYSDMGIQSTAKMFYRLRKSYPSGPHEFPPGIELVSGLSQAPSAPLPPLPVIAKNVHLGPRSLQRRGGVADLNNPSNIATRQRR